MANRNRIESVPTDDRKCRQFLEQARIGLADVGHVSHNQNRYNLAYDAAHDVGEAMLAGYGYRTRSGPGQHEALALFLAAVFDRPPANQAARHLEFMRRERNANRYRAVTPTQAATDRAEASARSLYAAAAERAQIE